MQTKTNLKTAQRTRELPEGVPCIGCGNVLTLENRSVEARTCRSCYKDKYSPEFRRQLGIGMEEGRG